MSTKRIKVKCQCDGCGGTGLYQGMAERDGAAVVCYQCDGTGESEVSYVPFTGRKEKKGVVKVYAKSCGYVQGVKDVTTKDGKLIRFSQAGCTYEEWKEGKSPRPLKDLYCPYQWAEQRLQSSDHKQHKLYKERCSKMSMCGFISDCPFHKEKDVCWKRYEELGGK